MPSVTFYVSLNMQFRFKNECKTHFFIFEEMAHRNMSQTKNSDSAHLCDEAEVIKIYLAILAKPLKLQRFDNINYLPSVKE